MPVLKIPEQVRESAMYAGRLELSRRFHPRLLKALRLGGCPGYVAQTHCGILVAGFARGVARELLQDLRLQPGRLVKDWPEWQHQWHNRLR